MWGAQIDNRGQEDMETYLQRLVLLASNKIIGGKVPTLEEIDHTSALAILAICMYHHLLNDWLLVTCVYVPLFHQTE